MQGACRPVPVGRRAVRHRFWQGNGLERLDELLACQQVLFACRALRRQVGGHRLVSRLQRHVEPVPQGPAGGAAQSIQFLPARAHVANDFGLLLDRQLHDQRVVPGTGGRCQGFSLQHEIVARPSTGPVLPPLELRVLGLQAVDAPAQRIDRCAVMHQFVDFDQVAVDLGHVTGGECGLGPRQHRRQALGASVAGGAARVARLLTPVCPAGLLRLLTLREPLLEAAVRGKAQRGIVERHQLSPAHGRIGCSGQVSSGSVGADGGGIRHGAVTRRRIGRHRRLQHLVEDRQASVEQRGLPQCKLDGGAQCFSGDARGRRVQRQLRLSGGHGQVSSWLRSGCSRGAGGPQAVQGLPGLRQPAFGRPLAVCVLAHLRRQLRYQRGELGKLRGVKQRGVQRLPCPVEFHHAVGGEQRLTHERLGRPDQPHGLSSAFALRDQRPVSLLGHAMNAAVMVAELTLGEFQAGFGRQRFDGREPGLQRHALACQRQQRGIVAPGGLQPGGPIDVRSCLHS